MLDGSLLLPTQLLLCYYRHCTEAVSSGYSETRECSCLRLQLGIRVIFFSFVKNSFTPPSPVRLLLLGGNAHEIHASSPTVLKRGNKFPNLSKTFAEQMRSGELLDVIGQTQGRHFLWKKEAEERKSKEKLGALNLA